MTRTVKKGLTLGAAALSLALCALGFAACGEHTHTVETWTTVTPATCTSEGKEEGVCSSCGETVERVTAALPHTFAVTGVLKAPTCTENGLNAVKCSVCGYESTETAPAQHTWRTTGIIKSPTCIENGSRAVVCTVCSAEGTVEWPALGHQWQETGTVSDPTCTEAGVVSRVCTRAGCGETGTAEIPALGHLWENDFTVDTVPTFEHAGSRSVHCERCGGKKDVTEIPKLDKSQKIAYQFRLTRANGDLLTAAGVEYEIFDEAGQSVGTGSFRSGTASAMLIPQTYTLKITKLPEGYTARTEGYLSNFEHYTTSGSVLCNVPLSASLLQTPATEETRYGLGSVMHDFTLTDVMTDQTLTLSELLREKKGVVLNFWYVDCMYCGMEFPELEAIHKRYGSEIAIISVNASARLCEIGSMSAADSTRKIKNFVQNNGYTFHFAEDSAHGAAVSWKFGVRATPVTYFIDCEGVVCAVVDGYISSGNEERLLAAVETTLSASRSAPTPSSLSAPAALPAKRKI